MARSADRDPTVLVVIGVTLLALVARLLLLGDRVAHWDEARVGYIVLDFLETGVYEYHPIVHGPFLHHVDRLVFATLGASDFTMRLVPALIGGLLPLVALLFRARLSDEETVALAGFLALNPILLYYSRFFRGDLPVGAFMFVAFALFVLAIDRDDARLVVPAIAFVALGFTVKENAIAYLAAWLGSLGLLLDHHLLLARHREEGWTGRLRAELARAKRGLVRGLPWGVVGLGVGFAVVVFFYAPRSPDPGAVSLGNALRDPGMWPAVVEAATVEPATRFVEQWVGPRATSEGGNPFLPYLGDLALTVAFGAASLVVMAVLGFATDRYGSEEPRNLVAFCFYWGVASLIGYPIITDIKAPWAAVHVVLPLAIPAAVGVGAVVGYGRRALVADDGTGVRIAAVVLLLVSGQLAGMAAYTSFVAPQADHNEVVQYAQPAGDLQATVEDMDAVAAANDGPDVLVYGEFFVDGNTNDELRPSCTSWFNALPLPWYWERDDVSVTCARGPDDLAAVDSHPPIVIAKANTNASTPRAPAELRERYPDYEARFYLLRTFDTTTVFLVDEERVP
jgi:uncharacterized protein (TIGR03663 family)